VDQSFQRRPVRSSAELQEFLDIVSGVPSITPIPRQPRDELFFRLPLVVIVGCQFNRIP
jgi:hypothetical protein